MSSKISARGAGGLKKPKPATHLFLRLKSLLEVRGEAVEKSFVAARAGTASRACCEKLCPVNWCRQCVTQWALTKASTLSGNRRN